jgi:hypothetical protein
MARPLSILIRGNQAPVPVGLIPWLAGMQFAFFSWSGTAGGTTDSEYFLGADCLHAEQIMPRIQTVALVNIDHS